MYCLYVGIVSRHHRSGRGVQTGPLREANHRPLRLPDLSQRPRPQFHLQPLRPHLLQQASLVISVKPKVIKRMCAIAESAAVLVFVLSLASQAKAESNATNLRWCNGLVSVCFERICFVVDV